jgi:hypothetical protein
MSLQHEVSIFLPHQSLLQRLASIATAHQQSSRFPFEIFLPITLVLPIAAIFQPVVAFVGFVAFLSCYVMQTIATDEDKSHQVPPSDHAPAPVAFSSHRSDQFADPIGSFPLPNLSLCIQSVTSTAQMLHSTTPPTASATASC